MTEALTAAADPTILSDDLSSNELAAMVGLAPDKSWQAGDEQSQYVRRTQPHNGISYGSLLPDYAPSSEHLSALLTRLAPYEQQIASTAAQPSIVDVTVWLVVRSDSDMTDIALSSAEMNAIAAMGATPLRVLTSRPQTKANSRRFLGWASAPQCTLTVPSPKDSHCPGRTALRSLTSAA